MLSLGAEILPGQLFQRGIFPKGWTKGRKAALLDRHNIGLFVTLVNHYDEEVESLMLERAGAYIFNPIPDGKCIDQSLLMQLAQRAVSSLSLRTGVVVQCRAGRNRSGLLSALVLIQLGHKPEEAISMVQERRPNALYNEHFTSWLKSL